MTANKRLRSKLIIPEFIEFISPCSSYALSIVLIGVADGRWEDMRKFDDKIPKREFDNFQENNGRS
uniref:Copine C-terminal domain-containing protein n=1 Tax=Brassica oleracea var. oleracea TaxID=109376 RepID=A0A0D3CNM6_BRAOL